MLNRDVDRRYQEKQQARYNTATGDAAYDAVWRAASAAGYLHRHETSQDQFTHARVAELVKRLGWG
jgi:hypothetical protein